MTAKLLVFSDGALNSNATFAGKKKEGKKQSPPGAHCMLQGF